MHDYNTGGQDSNERGVSVLTPYGAIWPAVFVETGHLPSMKPLSASISLSLDFVLHLHSIFVKVDHIMQFSRALFPLLLILLLFFAQQGGAMHALHHALAKQDQPYDKHAPHSSACGHCAAYSQLGGVLGSSSHTFVVIATPSGTVRFNAITFRSNQPLIAIARGPPGLLQEIA